jgi:hypothetical protein
MRRVLATFVIAIAAGSAIGGAAHANPAWEFTSPGNSFSNGIWDFGTAFTANSAVTVSGLGYYADPTNGQVDSNPVVLYQCADVACDSTGTEIASATVTNTYALNGHFRYVTVTPVNLIAGDSYEVVGISSGDNYTWDDPGFAVNSAITIIGDNSGDTDRWLSTSTPTFLNTLQGDIPGEDGIWGPDLFFGVATFTQPVPEPASVALLAASLVGLGVMRRRRR